MKCDPNCQPSILPRINEELKAKWRKIDAGEDRRQSSEDQQIPAIFAEPAKISLELRKFRWNCENFAGLAKISQIQRNREFSLDQTSSARHCS